MKWPEGTEDVARGVQDLLAAVEREDPALVPNLATYRLRRAEYSRVRSADKPVYVKGQGYVPQPIASQFEREGFTVEWSSRGWAD